MDKAEIKSLVEKVVASKSFGRSKTYANLLTYLVDCTLTDDVPKETTIATDIFGKPSFDPSQSTLVRVYVYNLRKKLDKYYLNEGLEESVVFKIPKGSYKVEFLTKTQGEGTDLAVDPSLEKEEDEFVAIKQKRVSKLKKQRGNNPILSGLGVLLGVSMLLNFLLFFPNESDETTFKSSPLWRDLYKSELPTLVIVGDLFVYGEHDRILGLQRAVRDPSVNSPQELEDFKKAHPREGIDIVPMSYAYLIRNSMFWVKGLAEVFSEIDKEFALRSMSRFNPKELHDNNVIVIGMLKTLGLFNTFFEHSRLDLSLSDRIGLQQEGVDTLTIFMPQGNPNDYHTNYGLMAKVPGPNSNDIYYFAGPWDTGTTQSIKNFTDIHLLKEIETAMMEKFGKIPKYYEVLFEVSGLDRMELKSKIVYLGEVKG